MSYSKHFLRHEVRQDSSSDEKSEDEEWEHLIPTNEKLCADWIKYPKVSGAKAKKKARPRRDEDRLRRRHGPRQTSWLKWAHKAKPWDAWRLAANF